MQWRDGESCSGMPQAGFQQEIVISIMVSGAAWLVGASGSARPKLAQKPGSRRSVGLLPLPNPDTLLCFPRCPLRSAAVRWAAF